MATAFNFARRPFRDERPVLLAAAAMILAAIILLVVNVRLYAGYQQSVAGTSQQIAVLEKRKALALHEAQESHTALDSYRVSNLALESKALLRLVAERQFSWTSLLARLERVLPAEVRVARLVPRFDSKRVTIGMGLVGKDGESVVRTISALSRDAAFSGITLRSETEPGRSGNEGHTFEVELQYAPAVSEGAKGGRR